MTVLLFPGTGKGVEEMTEDDDSGTVELLTPVLLPFASVAEAPETEDEDVEVSVVTVVDETGS